MQIKYPSYFGQLLHKKGFRIWFLYMFKIIEGKAFIEEELHKDLFQAFQDIYDSKETRQNINVPPRSGKTTFAKYFIAYSLALVPESHFIYTSFSQSLLGDISRSLALILEHSIFKAMYSQAIIKENIETNPIDDFWKDYLSEELGKATYSNKKIVTKQGGVILFASIGSAITGFGAGLREAKSFSGCLFIDDANKPADIHSQLMRSKVIEYYEGTLLTRLNESSIPIVNIQQRLHLEDLSGFLIKEYSFNTLKKSLLVDDRCQLPNQYDKKRVQEIQRNENMFMAQYQQEPVFEGGNLFKLEAFIKLQRNQLPIKYGYTFITGDLSYKDKQLNDYTVFSYWGVILEKVENRLRPKLYLIDVKRQKINAVDIERWIEPWIKPKLKYSFRKIWIEDKAHGIYLNQSFRKKGYPIASEKELKETLPRDTDKVTRANNIISSLDIIDPNCFLCIDIENYQELEQELLSFPNSVHDDFVDTLIDAAKIALFTRKLSIFDIPD